MAALVKTSHCCCIWGFWVSCNWLGSRFQQVEPHMNFQVVFSSTRQRNRSIPTETSGDPASSCWIKWRKPQRERHVCRGLDECELCKLFIVATVISIFHHKSLTPSVVWKQLPRTCWVWTSISSFSHFVGRLSISSMMAKKNSMLLWSVLESFF